MRRIQGMPLTTRLVPGDVVYLCVEAMTLLIDRNFCSVEVTHACCCQSTIICELSTTEVMWKALFTGGHAIILVLSVQLGRIICNFI